MQSNDRTVGLVHRIVLTALIVGCLLVLKMQMAHAFDQEKALSSFRKCRSCHEIGVGAGNKVGPHLNGLDGRAAASLGDFDYSQALLRAAEDGLDWTAESLDSFIRKPKAFIKGNRMNYVGLANSEERSNLVRWLLHFSPDGSELANPDSVNELLGASALAIDGDAAYGEYLSGECVTCHRVSGGDSTIPSITGWPEGSFVHALYEYKLKLRDNPVMQTVTARLGDEELAALAAYFGSLPTQ